ncbi:hypothetical protein N7510_006810 [Penicillium lagena]|uniref:uncharacterized protein n=1 Tax=Penicillium lagena TaxID=94218 RepID=UPI0025409106|nr:uncharacterized protein N7510_006810 [Penicillium lagena]KAJ5610091.1 hypothetical protein N7510_006810 [Penicillium lagena]
MRSTCRTRANPVQDAISVCDLTRPACKRCVKYGMDCPGYRDTLDLMFRNRGVGDVKKLVKRRQKVTSPWTQSESPRVVASSLSPNPSSVASRPSIALILDCYSVPVNGQRLFGHVDFLPVLLSEADEGSCLLYATDTLAGAYIANQTDSLPEREKASRTYGRALEAVRAALMSPTESAKDEIVVSVWALAAYEVCIAIFN